MALGDPDGPALRADLFFRTLSVGQSRVLEGRFIGAVTASVVGKRIAEDEYVILATTVAPDQALTLYRRRWEIETLFAALKLRGFDLEATHLRRSERIAKLIGLLWPLSGVIWSDSGGVRVKVLRR